MSEYACSVICRTCTRHEDVPCVLVTEASDHQEMGARHHRVGGACFKAIARHREQFPDHVVRMRHETPEQFSTRVAAETERAAPTDEDARHYRRLLDHIAERRAQMAARPRPTEPPEIRVGV